MKETIAQVLMGRRKPGAPIDWGLRVKIGIISVAIIWFFYFLKTH